MFSVSAIPGIALVQNLHMCLRDSYPFAFLSPPAWPRLACLLAFALSFSSGSLLIGTCSDNYISLHMLVWLKLNSLDKPNLACDSCCASLSLQQNACWSSELSAPLEQNSKLQELVAPLGALHGSGAIRLTAPIHYGNCW